MNLTEAVKVHLFLQGDLELVGISLYIPDDFSGCKHLGGFGQLLRKPRPPDRRVA